MAASRHWVHLLMGTVCVLVVFPVLWMISTALKAPNEIFAGTFDLWPARATLENFATALTQVPMVRLFGNSLLVAIAVTIAQAVTSTLAAYACTILKPPGRHVWFALFVATMMVPFQVTMIPNYLLFARLEMLNTYTALIIPQVVTGYGIFMLRQTFKNLPGSLVEAGILDGANSWQVLWRIVVPATRTALASLSVLFFINTWNQYLWPLLVTTDKLMKTLPVGMQEFVSLEGGTNWGPLMAAASMAVVPALSAYVVAQRYVLDSFVSAGLKE
ncbi:MAG TPA: carbohydrate ABC transporter permease [Methylomirabilota bacterium]|nr:carbohydrate ABC transporter permease [Methylomirabilota bacterium]